MRHRRSTIGLPWERITLGLTLFVIYPRVPLPRSRPNNHNSATRESQAPCSLKYLTGMTGCGLSLKHSPGLGGGVG